MNINDAHYATAKIVYKNWAFWISERDGETMLLIEIPVGIGTDEYGATANLPPRLLRDDSTRVDFVRWVFNKIQEVELIRARDAFRYDHRHIDSLENA